MAETKWFHLSSEETEKKKNRQNSRNNNFEREVEKRKEDTD